MKTRLIVWLYTSFLIVSAQEKFVVHYDVYPTFETLVKKEELKNKSVHNLFDGVDDALKDELKYKLEFNSEESLFSIIPTEPKNPNAYRLAKSFAASDEVYSRKSTISKVRKISFVGNTFFVNDTSRVEWTILNEQKYIDGKLCYKATALRQKKTNEKLITYEIVAWFSTDYPGYFGTKGYNGLPGLVVELIDDKVTFACSKIDKKAGVIENYNQEKIISEDEFERIVDKMMDSMGFYFLLK